MVEGVARSLHLLDSFFPERVRVVGAILRDYNKRYKRLEQWQATQLAHFMGILTISASDLRRAREERMISTLAWVTRNLLELSIWIDFCCHSEVNAKRFNDDAIRDMYGWSKAILSMYSEKRGQEHKDLVGKVGDLEKFAQSRGLPRLADDYKQVRDAAEELGCLGDFGPSYKLYSKIRTSDGMGSSQCIIDRGR